MFKFAVKFWWKMFLTIFTSKTSSKISFQTSPEVRHQFRRKLGQLHSGNRWCLLLLKRQGITLASDFAHLRLESRLRSDQTSSFCSMVSPWRSLAGITSGQRLHSRIATLPALYRAQNQAKPEIPFSQSKNPCPI